MINPAQTYGALPSDLLHLLVVEEKKGALTKEVKKDIFEANHSIVALSHESIHLQEEMAKIEELIEKLTFSPILFEENCFEFDETVYGERFHKMVAFLQQTDVKVTIESYCDGLTPRNSSLARKRVQLFALAFNQNQVAPQSVVCEPKGNIDGLRGIGLDVFRRKVTFSLCHSQRRTEGQVHSSLLPMEKDQNIGMWVRHYLEQQRKEILERNVLLKDRILEVLADHKNIIFAPLLFAKKSAALNADFYDTQIQLMVTYLNKYPQYGLKIQGGYDQAGKVWCETGCEGLAKARTKSLKEVLLAQGISEERLHAYSQAIREKTDYAMSDRRVVMAVVRL